MVYRDPADIEQQRKVEDEIEAATIALEVAVLAVITRRLGKLQDASMVEVYASMPSDMAEIRSTVSKGINNIQGITKSAIDNMGAANDEWASRFYQAKEIEQISASEHYLMNQTIQRETKAATDTVKAFCNSSVIGLIKEDARGKVRQYLPLIEAYKTLVADAANSMMTGVKSGEQAIAEAVRALSDSGLKVRYASGATRNLYSAVTTNVMGAYRTGMGELREIQGREFGADGVEVSAHALSAPDHVKYQGQQYSYEPRRGYKLWRDIERETAARPLETGANCGHMVSPILLDVSEPKYTKRELEDLKNRSEKEVTFKGLSGDSLTMTRYEASQYQRQIETSIRKGNEQSYLLKEAGQNTASLDKAIKARTAQYKRISKEAGLVTRMERTRAYVL